MIIEQTVNGIPGIAFYEDPPRKPEYRAQPGLAGALRALRRALHFAGLGDLSEAVRALEHAGYCRGLGAISGHMRPSTKRVDAMASKVSLVVGREIERRCGR